MTEKITTEPAHNHKAISEIAENPESMTLPVEAISPDLEVTGTPEITPPVANVAEPLEVAPEITSPPDAEPAPPPVYYKPRYPFQNSGFWMAGVSLALSLGTAALLAIGVLNNNTREDFNWNISSLVLGVCTVIFVLTMVWLYVQMANDPQQVVVYPEHVEIQWLSPKNPLPTIKIPYEQLTRITVADVPVPKSPIPRSFKGVQMKWKASAEEPAQEYILSSRNIINFDEMFDRLFNLAPKAARGTKNFRG